LGLLSTEAMMLAGSRSGSTEFPGWRGTLESFAEVERSPLRKNQSCLLKETHLKTVISPDFFGCVNLFL
jgi:hypothetical protein